MDSDVAVRALNGISLCSGVGGLDLALDLLFAHLGRDYRTVCHVEREAFAAAVLVARMADQTLDQAPVWDDLSTFDGRPWRGVVDCVLAGFPCQPFSVAGQQRGADDPRHLWPQVARVLREVRPRHVFLENVPGTLKVGEEIFGDLAEMGFDAAWGCLEAPEVGAPHKKRERWFCYAYRRVANASSQCQREPDDEAGAESWERARAHVGGDSGQVGDPNLPRSQGREPAARRDVSAGSGQRVGDSDRDQPQRVREDGQLAGSARTQQGEGDQRQRQGNTSRHSGALFPPGPDDVRWLTYDGPQPAVRRDADGLAYRMDQLRCCGNGVIPLMAAFAYGRLVDTLG